MKLKKKLIENTAIVLWKGLENITEEQRLDFMKVMEYLILPKDQSEEVEVDNYTVEEMEQYIKLAVNRVK